MTGPRERFGGITTAFGLTLLAAVAFGVVYVRGGDVRLEGVSLFVAFSGLAIGLGIWAQKHMKEGPYAEEHSLFTRPASPPPAVTEAPEEGAMHTAARMPRRMLAAAGGALAVALLLPLRSLYRGPSPAQELASTPWQDGRMLVREDGRPVRPGDLDVGESLTVYPEGHADSADASVMLIRVDPERLELAPERLVWTVDGLVGYSKLCTHAGCPVGQFLPRTGELMCPCHQSLFDVFIGAVPIAGPAARPLPQLPLGVADGVLVARGDFPEPVGPGYWRQV